MSADVVEGDLLKHARSGAAHIFGKKQKRFFRLILSTQTLVFWGDAAAAAAGEPVPDENKLVLTTAHVRFNGQKIEIIPSGGAVHWKLTAQSDEDLDKWQRALLACTAGGPGSASLADSTDALMSPGPSPEHAPGVQPPVQSPAAGEGKAEEVFTGGGAGKAEPEVGGAAESKPVGFVGRVVAVAAVAVAGGAELAAAAQGAAAFGSDLTTAVQPIQELLSSITPTFVSSTGPGSQLTSVVIGGVVSALERVSSSCSFIHPVFAALKGVYDLYQKVQEQRDTMNTFVKRLTYWSLVLAQCIAVSGKTEIGRPLRGLSEFQDAITESSTVLSACASASTLRRFLTAGRNISLMQDLDSRFVNVFPPQRGDRVHLACWAVCCCHRHLRRLEAAFLMMQRDLDLEATIAQYRFQQLEAERYETSQRQFEELQNALNVGIASVFGC